MLDCPFLAKLDPGRPSFAGSELTLSPSNRLVWKPVLAHIMKRSPHSQKDTSPRFAACSLAVLAGWILFTQHSVAADPVVARIEMRLALDDEAVDVIEKGDLLTVIEEREDDYVIVTHDGSTGAVDKNTVAKIPESSNIYTELIGKYPEEGRYYTLRASAWWALGKTEEALSDFDKAIELGYKEAHAYTSRGLFHAEKGNFKEAIADYDEALRIAPDDIAPIINRAAVHMGKRDYETAIKDYTLVLEKKENSPSILHQRAIAYKAHGNLDKAAADFAVLIENNSKDRTALMGRGYIRFAQAKHEGAIEDFSKAIELNNQDPVAFNNRGYNRVQIGLDQEAAKDYERAIDLAPKYALALQNQAWLLTTSEKDGVRDPAKAVEAAAAAAKLTNFQQASFLSAYAAALSANGDFEEAIGWQEKVVDLVSENYKEFAAKNLERYRSKRSFSMDPDQANEDEKAAAEVEGKKKQDAKKEQDADPAETQEPAAPAQEVDAEELDAEEAPQATK